MYLKEVLLRFFEENTAQKIADMFPYIVAGVALFSYYILVTIIQLVHDE